MSTMKVAVAHIGKIKTVATLFAISECITIEDIKKFKFHSSVIENNLMACKQMSRFIKDVDIVIVEEQLSGCGNKMISGLAGIAIGRRKHLNDAIDRR